jgi:predicted dehydrogenase
MDLMLWWFGRPKRIGCQWGRFVVDADNKADDNVAVTLGYEGMLAEVVVSYSCRSDLWREDKHFYFEDASLHVCMEQDNPMMLGRNKAPLAPLDIDCMAEWWTGTESLAVNHFLDCLTGKAAPEFGPEAAREALEIILLAYEAAAQGVTLTVPPKG